MRSDSFIDDVRRKAQRMAKARRHRERLWKQLAFVGVLGWVFVLPVVLGAIAGRLVRRYTQVPFIDVALLLAGVLVGAYAVWREVRRSLEDRR